MNLMNDNGGFELDADATYIGKKFIIKITDTGDDQVVVFLAFGERNGDFGLGHFAFFVGNRIAVGIKFREI